MNINRYHPANAEIERDEARKSLADMTARRDAWKEYANLLPNAPAYQSVLRILGEIE